MKPVEFNITSAHQQSKKFIEDRSDKTFYLKSNSSNSCVEVYYLENEEYKLHCRLKHSIVYTLGQIRDKGYTLRWL